MRPSLAVCLTALCLAAPDAFAQETAGRLSLELNRIDPLEGSCRLTFVAENALGADLDSLALETVLIDTEGLVERLTLFEFGALPDGVPRVRLFDIPGLACGDLARVLINGVSVCGAAADCAGALDLSTRAGVELIG